MERSKQRNQAVAAILTLFAGGVGFLYVGKIWHALGLSMLPVVVIALFAWSGLMFAATGFYAFLLIIVVVFFGAPALAVVYARRAGVAVLRPYQRWYVYIVWLLGFGFLSSFALGHRAEALGYETFRFPSSSMRETLLPGDYFVSNTWKYRDRLPVRGELVVFLFPVDPSIKYVKRVIGLPGDTVEIKQGVVRVNGEVMQEIYVKPENNVKTASMDATFVVPDESFFVLGDNRDYSNDSRYWGFVPGDHLHGSVEYIWFSWDSRAGIRFDRLAMRLS